ncbi:hypothetical protein [Oceanobacillus picturae]|nr:hypothetical protein [Oceanobacillus picturae]
MIWIGFAETSPFSTIKLDGEKRLRSVQVSGDENTIAYVYEDKGEGQIIIKIFRR